MNLLISMTLMADLSINNPWLWWQPWQRGRATGRLPQRIEPCHLQESWDPPVWVDVYIYDKKKEIIWREDVWLRSGVNYYGHYMWEWWWHWWRRPSVSFHLNGIIQVSRLCRTLGVGVSISLCVGTLLTMDPDGYWSPQETQQITENPEHYTLEIHNNSGK